jgi:hypothetical protein
MEAAQTRLQWIHGDSIANCDVLDVLAHFGDDTGCFMPYGC